MITESKQSRQSARIRHQGCLLVTGLFTIRIISDTCNLDIEVYPITRRCRFIVHSADLSALGGVSTILKKKLKCMIGP
jgi:hypothetical protein